MLGLAECQYGKCIRSGSAYLLEVREQRIPPPIGIPHGFPSIVVRSGPAIEQHIIDQAPAAGALAHGHGNASVCGIGVRNVGQVPIVLGASPLLAQARDRNVRFALVAVTFLERVVM